VESCVYDEVNPDDRRGTLLVQGVADNITDMCCHPFKTQLAISCSNGTLQVWDYDMKLLMSLREFNARTSGTKQITTNTAAKIARAADKLFLRPQCIAFDPSGNYIAVGFTTGEIRFLYSDSFEDLSTHTPSGEPILNIKFSPSGKYMAAYDSSSHVILFQK
jgi:cilia- and flagella-associated protein 251